ncbi:MAG: hypothetical protein WC992_07335 [Acholeplasmataceae bacterium]
MSSLVRGLPEMGEVEEAMLLNSGFDPNEWVTYAMMCEFFGVPKSVIQYAVKTGELPMGIKIGPRRYLPVSVLRYWKPETLEEADFMIVERGEAEINLPPAQRTQQAYLKAMRSVVSIDAWISIVKRAVLDAQQGDHKARQWLSDHLMGTPIRRVAALVGDLGDERITDDQRRELVTALFSGVRDERFKRPLNVVELDDTDDEETT